MRDVPVNLPFPFNGLHEYSAFSEQPEGTSVDLQNVVAVDPTTGRRRGAQRPGIEKFVSSVIQTSQTAASIQEIIHTVGPNFNNASGPGQLIINNPSSANWGGLNVSGTLYTSGGTDSHLYQMSCWDVDGNFYVATRPSSTSNEIDIQKYDLNGTSQWAGITVAAQTVVHGNTSASAFPVVGMVALGPYLYVMYDGTASGGASGSTDYNDAMFRYYLSTGEAVDGADTFWAKKAGAITGGAFTTHRTQYVAKSADYIGVVTTTGVANSSLLKLHLDVLNPETGEQLSTTTVQTVSGSDSDANDTISCWAFLGDGAGNFFISYEYRDNSSGNSTFVIDYRDSAGASVSGWSSPISSTHTTPNQQPAKDLAYDAVNNRLACVSSDVMGTGLSFVIYDVADKSQDHASDYNSVASWSRVYADEDGGFRLTTNAAGNNIIKVPSNLNATPTWTYDATDNDQDYPLSINTTNAVSVDELRPRESRLLVVAGGTVKQIDRESNLVSEVTSGANALDQSAPVIFATSYFPDIYFADGKNAKYYRSSTKTMTSWTTTAGSLPTNTINNETQRPRLICTWNARVVQSGLAGDPQNWFMSAMTNPRDWNYSPATTCETQAVAGNASDASEVQDVITALMPWNNDWLVFGMDHSLGQMSGNPAGGGRFDMLSDVTGVAWGRAYTQHPDKSLWFIGSRGGLYRLGLGEKEPTRVSSTTVDERLADLDLASTIIRLQWDDRMQGLVIALTPTDRTSETTHYYFDARNTAWFPWKFAQQDHNPKVIYLFDGDAVADRVMLLGSWDGYLRALDYDGTADDGTAIDSYVMVGPIQTPEMVPALLTGLTTTLGSASSDVTWSLHVGDSAEEAKNAAAIGGGTFGAGKNRWSRYRCSAHSMFLKLQNNSNSQTWQLESIQATVRNTSRNFARIH